MKTFPLITALCCSLLCAVASAQGPSAEEQRQWEETLRYLQSPRKQLDEEAQEIPANRSSWNGQGSWMPLRLVVRLGGEDELGLTDEQKLQLPFLYKENELGREWHDKMRQTPTPEYTQAVETIEAVKATFIQDDPYLEHASDELKNTYREAQTVTSELWLSALQQDIEETLTPEQMLQVRKLEMQLMPVLGIPFPSMYDPLDLTDEQKAEMNKITDEMKAEFDRLTMETAALKAERIVLTYGLLKGQSFASREEFQKSLQDVHRRYVPSAAMREKSIALRDRGTKFATNLQHRLMDVLTDEQLLKMQEILDAAPEFVKRLLAQFKAMRETQEKTPGYVPGPDSWRPGDPVPIQFKEERRIRRGFPRGE